MEKVNKSLWLLVFLCFLLTSLPVLASGDGNIDNGGGGLGEGSSSNYWSSGDDGVRVTVVRSADGSAVAASVDLTNKKPNDIVIHFGKNSKSSYKSGYALSPKTSVYSYINPTQALPRIISSATGGANLSAIKRYFTDEQVIKSLAGYVGMDFTELTNGNYKVLLEPIAYVTFQGTRVAFSATEAAKYNMVIGGTLRSKMPSLSHKNLPLAMFLETADLGYPAWTGSKTDKVTDEQIISSLGLGIVRFNEAITPEIIEADYEYRVSTDVVTAVTVSGGQSDPDHPVRVNFQILGSNYAVNNIYYPQGASQLVWVKWRTPPTEQHITIDVSVSGGGTASRGAITANIIDLDENPPPNPVADDRNDAYNRANAIIPANPQKTSAMWSVWRPWWQEHWVWHARMVWHSSMVWLGEGHAADCVPGCPIHHGRWEDQGRWEDEGSWVDEGWWMFALDTYNASLSASVELSPDEKAPTATESSIKSGYGVNIRVNAEASTSQAAATTGPQTAISFFPEFYYQTYWRLLDRVSSGNHAGFEFKNNRYSTFNRRTHFSPIWMPDGDYKVYTYLMDCWSPDGMLSMNLTDSVQINGNLWSDWHIAPQRIG